MKVVHHSQGCTRLAAAHTDQERCIMAWHTLSQIYQSSQVSSWCSLGIDTVKKWVPPILQQHCLSSLSLSPSPDLSPLNDSLFSICVSLWQTILFLLVLLAWYVSCLVCCSLFALFICRTKIQELAHNQFNNSTSKQAILLPHIILTTHYPPAWAGLAIAY